MQGDRFTERTVEIPWLRTKLTQRKPGRILDVGSAGAEYVRDLLGDGRTEVMLQDVRPFDVVGNFWGEPNLRQYVGDHRKWPTSWYNSFDMVTCISVIDHVGLKAYDQLPDREALSSLIMSIYAVLKRGGVLLVTTPVGHDFVTEHPGGAQRVFSYSSLVDLFPIDHWAWRSQAIYRYNEELDGYVSTGWSNVHTCGYLEFRAEAVACIEMLKR